MVEPEAPSMRLPPQNNASGLALGLGGAELTHYRAYRLGESTVTVRLRKECDLRGQRIGGREAVPELTTRMVGGQRLRMT